MECFRCSTSVIRFGKRMTYKIYNDKFKDDRDSMKKYLRKHKNEFSHINLTYHSNGMLCWYEIILIPRGD